MIDRYFYQKESANSRKFEFHGFSINIHSHSFIQRTIFGYFQLSRDLLIVGLQKSFLDTLCSALQNLNFKNVLFFKFFKWILCPFLESIKNSEINDFKNCKTAETIISSNYQFKFNIRTSKFHVVYLLLFFKHSILCFCNSYLSRVIFSF